MLVIHKSCRSFDLGDGGGCQDFTYDIQRAINDGLESLLLASDVLLKDGADEQHEFLAMFGKSEIYDQVLGRIKAMLELYQRKDIKINLTCGSDWIAQIWDQRKSGNKFAGYLDMTVPRWRDACGDVRPQAKVPASLVKSCCSICDIVFAWWIHHRGGRGQRGIVLIEKAFGVDKANPNSGLTISEIGIEEGEELRNLDCLTGTILNEVSHLIHLFGRKGSNIDLETVDIWLDLDKMDEFDAERDAVNTVPARSSWHNGNPQNQNAMDCLDSAFHALSLGVTSTGQNTVGGGGSTFGRKEEDDENDDDEGEYEEEYEEEDDENDENDENEDEVDEDEDDDPRKHPNSAHDAAWNADSIAYFILVLRYRKRGWEFDERTWTAQAVDDSCTSERSCDESDADDTASEEAQAYDSEDSDGAAYSGDGFEHIC